jgi:uncharacterized protein YkwD
MARSVAALVLLACGAAALSSGPSPTLADPLRRAADKGSASDDLQFCVDEVNRYRKKAGKPPLQRSPELEAFAAEGAAADTRARTPHRHFSRVPYPRPFSEMGENVIPWWPLKQYGSVREIMRVGTSGMWDEGPGGGHYENLVGNFTHVGCGIHVANGEVTVTQDFLRPPDPRK